ncbi:helix-turn-helix transcriptional regulator [Desulfovibrio sp. JY]|nr:helix-turn-helix transcriptional regulator [Desulfovibrio sp. JY]
MKSCLINNVEYSGCFVEFVSQISSEDWSYYDYIDNISDQIYLIMKQTNVSKAELSRRLGTSKPFVTKVLSGQANLTMKTLIKILHALGYKPETRIVPIDSIGKWTYTSKQRKPSTWKAIHPEGTVSNVHYEKNNNKALVA